MCIPYMLQTLLIYYFGHPFPSENNKPVYIEELDSMPIANGARIQSTSIIIEIWEFVIINVNLVQKLQVEKI